MPRAVSFLIPRAAVVHAALAGALVLILGARQGQAQTATFPPVTNRNFNIDLFEQPALGSPRLILNHGF